MADNVTINPGSGGDTIATDDIGGVQYPRTKIVLGDNGVNDGDVSAGNPLPIIGTVAVTDGDGSLTVDGTVVIDDGGGAITVDGTVAVTDGGGTISVDDGGGAITVDGTVTVTDGSGSLTVDGTVAVTQATAANLKATVIGAGTAGSADAGVVTIQGITSGTVVPVADGGGSLTVDGSVTVAQATAASLNATIVGTGGGGEVTITGTVTAQDGGGSISVDDGGSTVSIDDGGGIITVDGTVTVTDGSGSLTVDGTVTATQSTASSFNATVIGAGSAGTPNTGVVTIQGITSGTVVPISDGAGSITVDQATAANLNAAVVGTGTAGSPAGGVLTVQGVASGTGFNITNNIASSFAYGQTGTIGTAAVQVISGSTAATKGVVVKSKIGNTALLYVGDSGVTTANGFELSPGESISVPVDNANKVYCCAAASSQAITWMAI